MLLPGSAAFPFPCASLASTPPRHASLSKSQVSVIQKADPVMMELQEKPKALRKIP